MDIKELKTEFITSEVPNHKKHKTILLNLINKMPANPYQDVSKTDWTLPRSFERKYLEYFYSHVVKNVMDKKFSKSNCGFMSSFPYTIPEIDTSSFTSLKCVG